MLAVGVVTGSVAAFVAIWGLLRILERFSSWPFVVYRGLIGLLLLAGAVQPDASRTRTRLSESTPPQQLCGGGSEVPPPAIHFSSFAYASAGAKERNLFRSVGELNG